MMGRQMMGRQMMGRQMMGADDGPAVVGGPAALVS
jgi:hypothetical protein